MWHTRSRNEQSNRSYETCLLLSCTKVVYNSIDNNQYFLNTHIVVFKRVSSVFLKLCLICCYLTSLTSYDQVTSIAPSPSRDGSLLLASVAGLFRQCGYEGGKIHPRSGPPIVKGDQRDISSWHDVELHSNHIVRGIVTVSIVLCCSEN